MYGHTLLSVALTTLLVWQVWGARAARAWALGYLGHLLADARGFVPWLYPFRRYEFEEGEPGILDIMLRAVRDPVRISIESALLIWAVAALVARPQPRADETARSGER
jgi:hypothetical protein